MLFCSTVITQSKRNYLTLKSLMFTGNITNVLNLNFYTYSVPQKYNRVINKRLSGIKIIYMRINSVGKLDQKSKFKKKRKQCTFPIKEDFVYFLWMMVGIELLQYSDSVGYTDILE